MLFEGSRTRFPTGLWPPPPRRADSLRDDVPPFDDLLDGSLLDRRRLLKPCNQDKEGELSPQGQRAAHR